MSSSPSTVRQSHATAHVTAFAAMAAAAVFACATAAHAANKPLPEQHHAKPGPACESTPSGSSRSACIQEAAAARKAARNGQLTDREADFHANQLARCTPLGGLDKLACVARMDGAGTVEGSVESGGILRELTLTYITDPATGQPVAVEIPAPSAPQQPKQRP